MVAKGLYRPKIHASVRAVTSDARARVPRVVANGMRDALGDKPMCGGCGAKVGRAALQTVLGADFGDDAAEIQKGQVISTDHLRALTLDPVVMTRIAATHALGDIWAMGATPRLRRSV